MNFGSNGLIGMVAMLSRTDFSAGAWHRGLEQLRRELIEVVAPVRPGVPTRALLERRGEAVPLEQLHGALGRRQQEIVGAGGEPEQLQTFFRRRVVERRLVPLLPRRVGRRRRSPAPDRGPPPKVPNQSRAEDADVGELIEMGNRDVERLRCRPSTSRRSRDAGGRRSRGRSSRRSGMTSLTKSCSNSSGRCRQPPLPIVWLVWPAGITTIIGLAFFAAIRLSRMKPARPTEVHESSASPAPWSR